MVQFEKIPKFPVFHGKKILKDAYLMCCLAKIARKEGLLALEEYFEYIRKETGDFALSVFTQVLGGSDAVDIEAYGKNIIASSGLRSWKKLDYMVILTGALMIQKGTSQIVFRNVLLSLLGEKIERKYYSEFDFEEITDKVLSKLEEKAEEANKAMHETCKSSEGNSESGEDLEEGDSLKAEEKEPEKEIIKVPEDSPEYKEAEDSMKEIAGIYSSIAEDYFKNGFVDFLSTLNKASGSNPALKEMLSPETYEKVIKNDAAGCVEDDDFINNSLIRNSKDEMKKLHEKLCNVMSKVHITQMEEIAGKIYPENENFLKFIKKNSFMFGDIVTLDDKSVQKVLREIDAMELAKALKYTDNEVMEKIFSNMSDRAVAMMKEDMDYMGPVRLQEVLETQEKICSIIMALEGRGEIIIERNGMKIVQ